MTKMHYLPHTFGHYPYAIDSCLKPGVLNDLCVLISNYKVMFMVSIVNIETSHERQAEAWIGAEGIKFSRERVYGDTYRL